MMKTDPVCGQTIDPLRARAVAIVAGDRYYFCSTAHRDVFAADPARYVAALRPEPAVVEISAPIAAPPPPAAEPDPPAAASPDPVDVARFDIGGMTGRDDAERVRKAIAKVEGVVTAEIDLVTEVATLAITRRSFTPAQLVAALATVGYEAAPRSAPAPPDPAEAGRLELRTRWALLAAVPIFAAGLMIHGLLGVAVILGAALAIVGVAPPPRRGALEIQHYGAAVLLLLAALISATGGGGSAAAGAALVVAAGAQAARWLEARARGVAAEALAAVAPLPPTALRPGERVRVGSGEVVPVDGVVHAEHATVDESVSGGATAAPRGAGDAVVAGTRVVAGSLVVEARRVGADRALACLRAALLALHESSSPTARVAAALERAALPAAAAAGLAVALFQAAQGADLDAALVAAAGALVVVCPLAAALATPALRAVAGAGAARRGILFRNADALERAAGIRTFFVDKGATLTQGRREVAGDAAVAGADARRVVALAAAAEQATDAPLGRALRAYAEAQGTLVPPAERASYVAGGGVSAVVAGVPVTVGSRRMALAEGCEAAALDALAARLPPGVSAVFVLIEGRLAGAIGIVEPLRSGAAEFVAGLRRRGLRVALLTGDDAAAAKGIAAQAGIDEVHAGLGPDGKKRVVAEARVGGAVAVAGDSVDDAAALAAADVGIALARGAELELAAGGVTVLRGDLHGVLAALDIARRATLAMRFGLGLSVAHAAGATLLFAVAPLGMLAPPLGVASTLAVLGFSVWLARAKIGL